MSDQITRFFYWEIKFKDGTTLSQFDKDGNEVYIKDIAPKQCWVLQMNGQLSLDYNQNWFQLLETVHGDAQKVSWVPFTKEMKQKIESKQPHVNCEVVNEYTKIERRVPEGYFGHVAWSNKIHHGIGIKDGEITDGGMLAQYQGILFLGYLPRPEMQDADLEHTYTPGKVDEIIIQTRVKK